MIDAPSGSGKPRGRGYFLRLGVVTVLALVVGAMAASLAAGDGPIGMLTETAGTAFTAPLATFNDQCGSGGPQVRRTAHFVLECPVATIDWGDGQTDTGSPNVALSGGSNGQPVTVSGSHTYAAVQTFFNDYYSATIGFNGSTVTEPITVVAPPLTVTPAQGITGCAGAKIDPTLATFTDPAPNSTPGYYEASIAWGDGNSDTEANIDPNTSGPGFAVSLNHTYASAGTYTVTVDVTEPKSSQAAAPVTDQIVISQCPPPVPSFTYSGSPSPVLSGAPVQFNGSVATPSPTLTYTWTFCDQLAAADPCNPGAPHSATGSSVPYTFSLPAAHDTNLLSPISGSHPTPAYATTPSGVPARVATYAVELQVCDSVSDECGTTSQEVTVIPSAPPHAAFTFAPTPGTSLASFDGATDGQLAPIPASGEVTVVPLAGDPNLLNSPDGGITSENWDFSNGAGAIPDVACTPVGIAHSAFVDSSGCTFNPPAPYAAIANAITAVKPGGSVPAPRSRSHAAEQSALRNLRSTEARAAVGGRRAGTVAPIAKIASACAGNGALFPCAPLPKPLACHGAELGEGIAQPDCAAYPPFVYNFNANALARIGLESATSAANGIAPMQTPEFVSALQAAYLAGFGAGGQAGGLAQEATFLNNYSYLAEFYSPLGLSAQDGSAYQIGLGNGLVQSETFPSSGVFYPFSGSTATFRGYPGQVTLTAQNTAGKTSVDSQPVAFDAHGFPSAQFKYDGDPQSPIVADVGTPDVASSYTPGTPINFDYSGVNAAPGVGVAYAVLEVGLDQNVTYADQVNSGQDSNSCQDALEQARTSGVAIPYLNQPASPQFSLTQLATGQQTPARLMPPCNASDLTITDPVQTFILTGAQIAQAQAGAPVAQFSFPPNAPNVEIEDYAALLTVYDADGLEARQLITGLPVHSGAGGCHQLDGMQIGPAGVSSGCLNIASGAAGQGSIYYGNRPITVNGVELQADTDSAATIVIDDRNTSAPIMLATTQTPPDGGDQPTAAVGDPTLDSEIGTWVSGLEKFKSAGPVDLLAGAAAGAADASKPEPVPIAQRAGFGQLQGAEILETTKDLFTLGWQSLPGAMYRDEPIAVSTSGIAATVEMMAANAAMTDFNLQMPAAFGQTTSAVSIMGQTLPVVQPIVSTLQAGAARARGRRVFRDHGVLVAAIRRRHGFLADEARLARDEARAHIAAFGGTGSPYATTVDCGTEVAGSPMTSSACPSTSGASSDGPVARPADGSMACPAPPDGTGIDENAGALQFTYDPATGDWCGRVDIDVPVIDEEGSGTVIFHGSSLVYAEADIPGSVPVGGAITLGPPIDVSIATDPTVFQAHLGMSIADIIDGQVQLSIQSSEPGADFTLSGSVSLANLITLGSFHLDYDHDSSTTTFGGEVGASFGPASFDVDVNGGASPAGFDVEGDGQACLGLCLGVHAIVSSLGVGACGDIDLGLATLHLGLSYAYGGGFNVLTGSCDFSNLEVPGLASDEAQAAAKRPTGQPPRITGPPKLVGSDGVEIPSGLPSVAIVLHGAGAPPDVVFNEPACSAGVASTATQPCGRQIASPSDIGDYAFGGNVSGVGETGFVQEDAIDDTSTLIVTKPMGGLWTWTTAPAVAGEQAQTRRLAFQSDSAITPAVALPEPALPTPQQAAITVHALSRTELAHVMARPPRLAAVAAAGPRSATLPLLEIHRLRVLHFTLPKTYKAPVMFVSEDASGAASVLGLMRRPGRSGSMMFDPPTGQGPQKLKEVFFGANNTPRASIVVGSYTPPPPPVIPRVRIVKIVRGVRSAEIVFNALPRDTDPDAIAVVITTRTSSGGDASVSFTERQVHTVDGGPAVELTPVPADVKLNVAVHSEFEGRGGRVAYATSPAAAVKPRRA